MVPKEKEEDTKQETSSSLIEDFIASESSQSLMRSLVGNVGDIGDFYFPPDVVGGVCPRVVGEEETIVWNAAAEACDNERVHIVWRSIGQSIWYLAIRSSDLASHTNSWCPLAALLPTKEDLANLPICYTYFGDELAVLMVVGAEELHIFRGTAPVIRAKAERVVREHGEKSHIVNIDPFRIGQMTPIPWYSVSLFENRARRVLAALSVFAALSVVGLGFVVWLLASLAMISSRHDLSSINDRTQSKVMALMRTAEDIRKSPLREQIESFLKINEGLLSLNGFLTVYNMKENVVRWKALVPPSATGDRISALGGKSIETTDKGTIIGNDAQIKFDKTAAMGVR